MTEYCPGCGEPFVNPEADHVVAWANGGETEMDNAQALCRKCNLKKSNRTTMEKKTPRGWQEEAFKDIKTAFIEDLRENYMLVAGGGSGKTFLAAHVFYYLKTQDIVDEVVIISPTVNIAKNWSVEMKVSYDIDIDHNYGFTHKWPGDCDGISITYQSLSFTDNIERLKRYMNNRIFLIIDEVHHSAKDKSWGDSIKYLGRDVGKRLLLTGTPDRGDDNPIPYVEYEKLEGDEKIYRLKYNFMYSYPQSVVDGVCCGIIFPEQIATGITYEGNERILAHNEGTPDEQKELFRDMVTVEESENCYVYKTFLKANDRLEQINQEREDNDRAGMIVCKRIEDAKNIYNLIVKNFGTHYVDLITSEDQGEASKKIDRFKYSKKSWLVTVRMVSEGVDIPRLRVGVYASTYTTMLFFQQLIWRFVRNPNQTLQKHDVAYVFIPQYNPLSDNAHAVMDELIRLHVYEDIERREREWEETGPRIPTDLFGNILTESNSVDDGSIYKEDKFELDDDKEADRIAREIKTSKDIVFDVWKLSGTMKKKFIHEDNASKEPEMTITDEKEYIRRQINDLAKKIAFIINGKQYPIPGKIISDVHMEANKACGFYKASEATVHQLNNKLELLERQYIKLR